MLFDSHPSRQNSGNDPAGSFYRTDDKNYLEAAFTFFYLYEQVRTVLVLSHNVMWVSKSENSDKKEEAMPITFSIKLKRWKQPLLNVNAPSDVRHRSGKNSTPVRAGRRLLVCDNGGCQG